MESLVKHSGAMVQQFVHKLLVDLVRDDVKAMVLGSGATTVPIEAFVQFIAGALFGLLMWWSNGKCDYP